MRSGPFRNDQQFSGSKAAADASPSTIGEELSLSYNSRIIADTQVRQLSGNPGIGFYQIRFSIELSRPAWPGDDAKGVYLSDMRARVLVGRKRDCVTLLGMAHPEAAIVLRPGPYSEKSSLLFDLDLSPQQVFELEALRGGGDLHFELQIMGQTFGPNGAYPARDDIFKQVTLSDWRNVLEAIGYADILVLGFEIPTGKDGAAAAAAAKCLRRAQEDLLHGRYDAVVSQCRLALEGIHLALGEVTESAASAIKYANGKDRKLMTKVERARFIGEAVRHFAHLAHHPNSDGIQEIFSRTDAQAILACTVASIDSTLSRERGSNIGLEV
jgi:hypothetical protein